MNTLSMARKKKELTPNQQLARAILDQYQPKSVEDMQNALKDIFGPMFEAMLQGEMNSHLGCSNNERGDKETPNRRNGYTKKTLKTTVGNVPIEVPRDREGTFEPVVVPKRKRDVSAIEDKVLAMYAKGMSSVILRIPLRTFMVLRFRMKRSPRSRTASWDNWRNGRTGH